MDHFTFNPTKISATSVVDHVFAVNKRNNLGLATSTSQLNYISNPGYGIPTALSSIITDPMKLQHQILSTSALHNYTNTAAALAIKPVTSLGAFATSNQLERISLATSPSYTGAALTENPLSHLGIHSQSGSLMEKVSLATSHSYIATALTVNPLSHLGIHSQSGSLMEKVSLATSPSYIATAFTVNPLSHLGINSQYGPLVEKISLAAAGANAYTTTASLAASTTMGGALQSPLSINYGSTGTTAQVINSYRDVAASSFLGSGSILERISGTVTGKYNHITGYSANNAVYVKGMGMVNTDPTNLLSYTAATIPNRITGLTTGHFGSQLSSVIAGTSAQAAGYIGLSNNRLATTIQSITAGYPYLTGSTGLVNMITSAKYGSEFLSHAGLGIHNRASNMFAVNSGAGLVVKNSYDFLHGVTHAGISIGKDGSLLYRPSSYDPIEIPAERPVYKKPSTSTKVEVELNYMLLRKLAQISASIEENYRGAVYALNGKGPDYVRHTASSLRQMFIYVVEFLPNKPVLTDFFQKNLGQFSDSKRYGSPESKRNNSRIAYLFLTDKHPEKITDDEFMDLIYKCNEGVHTFNTNFSQEQALDIFKRSQSILLHVLEANEILNN